MAIFYFLPTAFVLFALGAGCHFYTMQIALKEGLSILEGGDWVKLTFITANVKKGTGGKVVVLDKCRIARNTITKNTAAGKERFENDSGTDKRNPNHNLHFTRNVQLLNKSIITIHPILITHINQHTVI